MENASKALLIAAAVLIVILLIAFGMRIFQQTGDIDVGDTADTIDTATKTGTKDVSSQIDIANGNVVLGQAYEKLDSTKTKNLIEKFIKNYEDNFYDPSNPDRSYKININGTDKLCKNLISNNNISLDDEKYYEISYSDGERVMEIKQLGG